MWCDSLINLPTGDREWEVWKLPGGLACIWCLSTLSGIKEGGGRVGWGKGQEKERRLKRAGGEKGVSTGGEAEPKGEVSISSFQSSIKIGQ